MRPTVPEIVQAIRAEAARRGSPWLGKVVASICPQAEAEHRESERQFAHVGCGRAPLTICYARSMNDLPLEYKLGVVVHEFGHFVAGGPDLRRRHGEADANAAGEAVTGIAVRFDGPLHLERSRAPTWLLEALS